MGPRLKNDANHNRKRHSTEDHSLWSEREASPIRLRPTLQVWRAPEEIAARYHVWARLPLSGSLYHGYRGAISYEERPGIRFYYRVGPQKRRRRTAGFQADEIRPDQ